MHKQQRKEKLLFVFKVNEYDYIFSDSDSISK